MGGCPLTKTNSQALRSLSCHIKKHAGKERTRPVPPSQAAAPRAKGTAMKPFTPLRDLLRDPAEDDDPRVTRLRDILRRMDIQPAAFVQQIRGRAAEDQRSTLDALLKRLKKKPFSLGQPS